MTDMDFVEPYDAADTAFAEQVVALLKPILNSLSGAFPTQTEILLQDLTRMPTSIAAIAQPITGRAVGGPPTNVILEALRSGDTDDHIGYRAQTSSGMALRSSAIYFRGPSGRQVVCLCVNSRIDDLLEIEALIGKLTTTTAIHPAPPPIVVDEEFPATLDSLVDSILTEEIGNAPIDVELMKKQHKLEIAGRLDKRGFFALRGSVELAAKALGVSRHTIYNYLNELERESSA